MLSPNMVGTVRNVHERDINAIGAAFTGTATNLLKSTGYVMHQQVQHSTTVRFATMYLCVLYLSENKQRLVPLTA
jgi:acyl-CoA hydrolase